MGISVYAYIAKDDSDSQKPQIGQDDSGCKIDQSKKGATGYIAPVIFVILISITSYVVIKYFKCKKYFARI